MPTVDTSFAQPAPPVMVTAPDGILTARVDTANAGVLLSADYSATPGAAFKVRFYRTDGSLVRSGDPAWAPGGVAIAYDHEASLAGAAAYYAVPEDSHGIPGAASDTLAVTIPWPWDPSDVWLKNVETPSLSVRVPAATFEETARPFRSSFSPISGARLGVSSWDVPGGLSATLTVKTGTEVEYRALLAVLDGSPLLIQSHPTLSGIPADLFMLPVGDGLSLRKVETGTGWALRAWPLQLTECRRPATLDSPLVIPGSSYDDSAARFASYDAEAATFASYNAVLGVS